MPAYCSVPLTYAKLIPNVCSVHQRMDKISHTSAYVGAIRCGVSTPLLALYYLEWFKTALDNHDQQVLTSVIGKLCINNKYSVSLSCSCQQKQRFLGMRPICYVHVYVQHVLIVCWTCLISFGTRFEHVYVPYSVHVHFDFPKYWL